VVFDIDDLLVDPGLIRVDVIDGIRTSGLTEKQWREHCARFLPSLTEADYCTVPTEELAVHLRYFNPSVLVLPNGFDHATYQIARRAARRRRAEKPDGLVRIGYAGGTRTHQRDFMAAAEAVAHVLRDRPQCRLVLFRRGDDKVPLIDVAEFPAFAGMEDRIEWRDRVPLEQLPEEIAHFHVNIAPIEVGNIFSEAKSELKFFEAALVDVATVASPSGPFRRAIRNGITGYLASHSDEWYSVLLRLVDEPAYSLRIARAAHRDALWRCGPLRRANGMHLTLRQLLGDSQAAAEAFALELYRRQALNPLAIHIPEAETVYEADQGSQAELTIVLPLYNCARDAEAALESAREQTLQVLDLVIVDDASTDTSPSVALDWARCQVKRFNRIAVLRNNKYSGVNPSRNVGIDAAETPWVLPLDIHKKFQRNLAPPLYRQSVTAARRSLIPRPARLVQLRQGHLSEATASASPRIAPVLLHRTACSIRSSSSMETPLTSAPWFRKKLGRPLPATQIPVRDARNSSSVAV
jgi:glycosyltransferase involved in cell wall biosynthesis